LVGGEDGVIGLFLGRESFLDEEEEEGLFLERESFLDEKEGPELSLLDGLEILACRKGDIGMVRSCA
jgi:hypothetical protein